MKKILFAAALILLLAIFVFALSKQKTTISSDKKEGQGFAVIELFTSEGCSSCPPADEAISEIQKDYNDKNVLALGFHVDYWDRLGWKDPFSSADFTSRQKYYADIFKLTSIYTPEAVINGKSEFIGSDKNKIINNVDEQLKLKPTVSVLLNADENSSGKIDVNYSIQGDNTSQEQMVILLIQKAATTNVKRGENGGRILHHINIVREISYLPVPSKEEKLTFDLPQDLKKDNVFVAGFIQNKKTGIIIGLGASAIK